ncbi:Uncharacterised protein [Vibrio cholerae]|nr:Uncharacterised protein [Vibrio cholerae]
MGTDRHQHECSTLSRYQGCNLGDEDQNQIPQQHHQQWCLKTLHMDKYRGRYPVVYLARLRT